MDAKPKTWVKSMLRRRRRRRSPVGAARALSTQAGCAATKIADAGRSTLPKVVCERLGNQCVRCNASVVRSQRDRAAFCR